MRQQVQAEVFADLIDSFTDTALIALTAGGEVLSWNSGAEALSGFSAVQALGKPLGKLLSASILNDLPSLADKAEVGLEQVLRRADGQPVTVVLSVKALTGGGYGLRMFRASGWDEFPCAAALRASEERFRELASAIPQIIWIAKSNGDFEELNERAAEFVGVSADALTGWSWRHAIHPDDVARVVEAWQKILETETPCDIEFRLRRADGVYRWHVGRQFPVRGATGAVERWYGTCTDIDDLKRAQQILSENDVRLSEAQRIAKMGGWSWEPESGHVWWSDTLYELLGVDRSDFQPSFDNFISILHPDDREHAIRRVETIFSGAAGFASDLRVIRRRDGELIWIHSQATVVRRDDGTILRIDGTDQDITDRKRVEEALRVSEMRYRTLVEHAGDSIFLHDSLGVVVDVNERACESLGLSRTELLGKTPLAFDPQATPARLKEILATLDRGESLAFDTVHQRKNGETFPVEIRIRPFSAEGRRFGLAMVRDITERMRAEASLRESEHRFRNVLDNSHAIIFLKDLSGRYLFVNRYGADAIGVPRDRFVGKTAHEVLPAALADQFERNDFQVLDTLRPKQFEETALAPDGRVITMLTTIFPLFLSDGTPYAICGIGQDISELKRTQEERDRLWEMSPDPLCVAGIDGYFKQLSPAWGRLLGWSDSELLSKPWLDLVHPEDYDATVQVRASMKAGELVTGFVNRFRCRNGDYRWFSWNWLFVPDSQRIYGFVRDVTEEKQLSEMARRSQKLEAVGRLAGGIAHDFNNLLLVINGHSELLLAQASENHDQRQMLGAIRDAGERAARLTSQLLSFSRQAVIQPKVVDLNEVVESCAAMFRRLIGEDIHLELKLHPGSHVQIDQAQLEQVLLNLTVNARDAMPQGGRLLMAISDVALTEPLATDTGVVEPGVYRCLTVSDAGCGMTKEVKRRIFEPFYTTKSAGQGTGLGLAMVYGIVRQAGGSISVESGVGAGTTFQIFLPAVAEAAPVGAGPKSAPKCVGPETILITEDELPVRKLLRRALEIQGYAVLEAGSAIEAEQVAERHSGEIHLLITDVVMPNCDGGELAASIRRSRPGIPVLFVSGYADDRIVHEGLALPGDSFLQKPFSISALVERVRALLDSSPSSAS